ncbi:MAG: hypothetical protein Q8O04_03565 [Deltaproteobacteria bacterium]|jgi:hypothetical protein|nr:hypothetical protein [Deltaproteobacteria bacterium]
MSKDQKEKKHEKLTADDEVILRAAKEIVIKFIETGRVSPTSFEENFQKIYSSIKDTVLGKSR